MLMMMIALLIGCNDGGSELEGDTTASGAATYEDAETEPTGEPKEPASPPPQDMQVTVEVSGSGTLSGLQPDCELEGATGQFTGLLDGEGRIEDDGTYVSAFASEDASFTTPSGSCDIPDLQIGSVTDVVVRAELENTQENCETYCDSKASAAAEQQCGADASSAECRTEAEATYAASCEQECTGSTTRRIVAETSLGVDAIAAINASGLTGQALGDFEADLTFDRIEEENGEEVDETP